MAVRPIMHVGEARPTMDGAGAYAGNDQGGQSGETGDRWLVRFGAGDEVHVRAGEVGVRFFLVSWNPIGEPVAWGGPIVMNTEEELMNAFRELESGTFIRHR